MIHNHQPSEKQEPRRLGGSLDVHSVFDTIQGEGTYAGIPATFVRLAGCNLMCHLCDTDYTQGRHAMTAEELRDAVNLLPRRSIVVITGGEPFRQDFRLFAEMMISQNRIVQVETNGTLYLEFDQFEVLTDQIAIICSPKTAQIHPKMWRQITALKYVVESGHTDALDGLPLRSVGPQYGRPARAPSDWKGTIYVQPLDSQDTEKNSRNIATAVESCMDHGYRLCLQTQKYANLP